MSSEFNTTTVFDQLMGERDSLEHEQQLEVFDACQPGMLLRGLALVHAVLGIGLLFGTRPGSSWSIDFGIAALVGVPATLCWLLLLKLGRRVWVRLRLPWQSLVLSTLAGLIAWALCMPLQAARLLPPMGAGPALAAALLAALFHQHLRFRAKMQLPAATRARLTELQSRIRPHFLFNTLNTAIALVRIDPGRAESVLEDLAELFRVALVDKGQAVSLAEELLLAQRYLAIEELRFGERLKVEWDLDYAAGSARVPALILQPLVENAVRHGIEPSSKGGKLRIRTQVRRDVAMVTIDNTLPETPNSASKGHGIALRNVRERLRLMHDVQAQITAGPDNAGQGRVIYRVQLSVPL